VVTFSDGVAAGPARRGRVGTGEAGVSDVRGVLVDRGAAHIRRKDAANTESEDKWEL
jgi:hypothetical protein